MNLIKCHIHYLFTKYSIIIFCLTVSVIGLIFIGNSNINENITSIIINEYYLNSQFASKLILNFVAIFIFANSIYSDHDFYAYFILTNIPRSRYIITKIIACMIIIIYLSTIVFIMFLAIGYVQIKGFYLQLAFLESFVTMTLTILIFGLYAFLAMQVFNNHFVNIFVYGLVIISNNLDNGSFLGKIFLFLLPSDNSYGVMHLIYLLFLLVMINSFIYLNKDLSY